MGRVQGPAPRLIVFARNADGDIVRGSQSSFQKDRAQEHPPWGGCGFDERTSAWVVDRIQPLLRAGARYIQARLGVQV